MESNREVFIKMCESEFNEIPNEIKERYFNSKNVSKEVNDWQENMKDSTYSNLYKTIRKTKKIPTYKEFIYNNFTMPYRKEKTTNHAVCFVGYPVRYSFDPSGLSLTVVFGQSTSYSCLLSDLRVAGAGAAPVSVAAALTALSAVFGVFP